MNLTNRIFSPLAAATMFAVGCGEAPTRPTDIVSDAEAPARTVSDRNEQQFNHAPVVQPSVAVPPSPSAEAPARTAELPAQKPVAAQSDREPKRLTQPQPEVPLSDIEQFQDRDPRTGRPFIIR